MMLDTFALIFILFFSSTIAAAAAGDGVVWVDKGFKLIISQSKRDQLDPKAHERIVMLYQQQIDALLLKHASPVMPAFDGALKSCKLEQATADKNAAMGQYHLSISEQGQCVISASSLTGMERALHALLQEMLVDPVTGQMYLARHGAPPGPPQFPMAPFPSFSSPMSMRPFSFSFDGSLHFSRPKFGEAGSYSLLSDPTSRTLAYNSMAFSTVSGGGSLAVSGSDAMLAIHSALYLSFDLSYPSLHFSAPDHLYSMGSLDLSSFSFHGGPEFVPFPQPSAAPTMQVPTASDPIIAPTAEPTMIPSVQPTFNPSTSPTAAPIAPTAVPTESPTLQSAPVIIFDTTFQMDGATSTELDEASETAVLRSFADIMDTDESNLEIVDVIVVNDTRRILSLRREEVTDHDISSRALQVDTFTLDVIVRALLNLVDTSDEFDDAESAFDGMKAALNNAFANGTFSAVLNEIAEELNATVVQAVDIVETLSFSELTTIAPPSFQPTEEPTKKPSDSGSSGPLLSVLVISLLVAGGITILALGVCCGCYLRSSSGNKLFRSREIRVHVDSPRDENL